MQQTVMTMTIDDAKLSEIDAACEAFAQAHGFKYARCGPDATYPRAGYLMMAGRCPHCHIAGSADNFYTTADVQWVCSQHGGSDAGLSHWFHYTQQMWRQHEHRADGHGHAC